MRKLLTIPAVLYALFLFSSCGTVLPHKQGIKLFNYSDDVKLKVDGVSVQAKQVYMASKGAVGGPQATFYGAGVDIDRRKAHTLTMTKGGKTVDIPLHPKLYGTALVLNLTGLGGGPLGILIDASTGYWKNLKPRYVDVSYKFGESKKKGYGKLKRQFKRKFKH